MKKFALRIFYILDANERQNQLALGCTTIHAIFLLAVRRIRMFFSLKPSPYQGKGNHPSKFWLAGIRRFGGVREQTSKQTHSLTYKCFYRVMENLYCVK